MSLVSTYALGYSATTPAESYLLMYRKDVPLNGTRPMILCLHARGGTSLHFLPNANPALTGPGYHAWQLAEAGYIVLAVDAGGTVAWGNATAQARIADAIAFMNGKAKTDKIGVMGWSMGGATALNWIKRNPAKFAVGWLWAPASDYDFFNGTAGYVPSYNAGGIASGSYSADLQAAFNPYSPTSDGYRIHDEPASFAGIAPIKIAHAEDDATIPFGMNQDLVTRINSNLVTFRDIPNGGHSGLFAGIPALEVIQHFRASL